MSNTGSPQFTDFPSLCACSESSLTNLIGSGLNLLCFQSHSKTECRWTGPEVAILGADQKERGLWEREWSLPGKKVVNSDRISFSSVSGKHYYISNKPLSYNTLNSSVVKATDALIGFIDSLFLASFAVFAWVEELFWFSQRPSH